MAVALRLCAVADALDGIFLTVDEVGALVDDAEGARAHGLELPANRISQKNEGSLS